MKGREGQMDGGRGSVGVGAWKEGGGREEGGREEGRGQRTSTSVMPMII